MKCPFCLSDDKISREHVFSKAICDAVGLDRSILVATVDRHADDIGPMSPLSQKAVRLPCERCNSGWMSDLERNAARTIRRWMSEPSDRLTKAGTLHLRRWLVKTAVVLGFSDNGARRFMNEPTEVAVPDITVAKQVAAGIVPDEVVAGAARVNETRVLWGAGNATVHPSGPDRISCRAVNVAAFNLGSLQLWVAIPVVRPDALRLPRSVSILHPNLRSRSLHTRSGDLDPTQVIAEYSDATSTALFAALAALSGVGD